MAFGKIAVQTSSGDVEEYELTKPTTSVGRQPGNDIVLATAAVSRYHAQFDVSDGGVFLVDLGTVNGTFVNDTMVEPNGRVPMNDGDIIAIGDMQLRFYAPEARSGSKRAVLNLDTEARTEEEEGVPFRLILDEPQQSVAPGARLQLTLIIENLEDYEYPVTVELSGLDEEWAKTNRREAMLGPKEATQALIAVRPPRSSATRPGLYPLTVKVALKDDPSQAVQAIREIDVVGYSGLGMAIRPGRSGNFNIAVQNQGNVPLDIQMGGFHPEKVLRFQFRPSEIHLAPGQTQQVALTVQTTSAKAAGASKEIPFAVVARSLDAAGFQAPVPARLERTSSWPQWILRAGVPLVVGAFVVLALVFLALYFLGIIRLPSGETAVATPSVTEIDSPIQDTTPSAIDPTLVPTPVASIVDFSADPAEAIYQTDSTILLRWTVESAGQVALLGPNDRKIELTPGNLSTGTYEFPISAMSLGSNEYTLTVTGKDGQDRSRSTVVQAVALPCVVPSGTRAFTLPNVASDPAAQFATDQVVILGRTESSLWARVAYNDLESLTIRAWIAADALTCPPSIPNIDQFLVIPGVTSESAPPTPEP